MKAPITVDVVNEQDDELEVTVEVFGDIPFKDVGDDEAMLLPPYVVRVTLRRKAEPDA